MQHAINFRVKNSGYRAACLGVLGQEEEAIGDGIVSNMDVCAKHTTIHLKTGVYHLVGHQYMSKRAIS